MTIHTNRWCRLALNPEHYRRVIFCMPCSRVSSDGVVLGPVAAVQGGSNVRGRLALSGEIWGSLVLLILVAGSPPIDIVVP